MDEILAHKLDTMAEDLSEIKGEVKGFKEESPIYRIRALEAWKSGINKFLTGIAIAIIGAFVTVFLTR